MGKMIRSDQQYICIDRLTGYVSVNILSCGGRMKAQDAMRGMKGRVLRGGMKRCVNVHEKMC